MELDQILKHVEWLDDERRKDKDVIARQEDRLAALEGNIMAAHQQIKDLSGEITRLSAIIARMDQYDEALLQQRIEANRQFEEIDRQVKKREEEVEKVRRVEMRAIESNVADIRKELEPIAGLKRSLQARVEEEVRLGRAIDDLRVKTQDMRRSEEEYSRTYRLIEDGRRQDAKRLVDLIGEVTALRKRMDEQRGQSELLASNFRKVEARLNEVVAAEGERRETQTAFLDKQNLMQVERDRIWKEWGTRFEAIEVYGKDVETQLQLLESAQHVITRDKEALDELTQRVERRINEITEIQRLAEERFRQEWVTFRADDQKRWTNYTLTQEEQRSETTRHYERVVERVTHLEDTLQELHDLLQQVNEQTEKRLQSLLALTHDWVATYERTLGNIR
jgi:chromosome segregation ATPase